MTALNERALIAAIEAFHRIPGGGIRAAIETYLASEPDAVAVEREAMRKFIERISEHNCGCTPICHCDDNIPALQAWKYAVRDEALEILARSQP